MAEFAAVITEKVTLNLAGVRELLDASKTEELLKEWTDVHPTAIKLSNKSFDLDAAQKVADYLNSRQSNIDVADISDIIAGRPEDLALQVLRIITSGLKRFELTEVNVSDNAMGKKGVDACKEILQGKKIQKLYVCNDGLSAEASEYLAEILLTDGIPPLELFHFYNNMGGNGAGVAISKIIAASSDLTDLRFSATRCGKEGCMEIASSIGAISKLQRVDLSDNTFGAKASGKLGESLKNHLGLQSLNLRDDGMGADGFEAFLEALESTVFPELTLLDLSGNDLDEDVMGNLIEWLPKAVPNLQHLALDDNEIGSDGAILLTKILPKLKKLTHLSICTAEVTGKGGLLLARAVARLPSFVKLDVNGNAFSENAVEAITKVLKNAKKALGDLDDNDEDGENDLDEIGDESDGDDEESDEEDKGADKEVDDLAEAVKGAKI